eukprot:3660861-Pyramimonas_sp.AAC.2
MEADATPPTDPLGTRGQLPTAAGSPTPGSSRKRQREVGAPQQPPPPPPQPPHGVQPTHKPWP